MNEKEKVTILPTEVTTMIYGSKYNLLYNNLILYLKKFELQYIIDTYHLFNVFI